MIKIDKRVAIPKPAPRGVAGVRTYKYPWVEMKPGDSFFAPGVKHSGSDGEGKQFSMAIGKKLHPDSKWVTRAITEGGVKGLRVWRVS